jgi:parvulin-like peptidyl-prolyl isomerase
MISVEIVSLDRSMQIGNFQLPMTELLPLLNRYQILPRVLLDLEINLAIDEAIAPIPCSDEEKIVAIQQLYDRHQFASHEQVQDWLDRQYLDFQQLEEIAIRHFKIDKFKWETWGIKLESYFLQRKEQLDKAVYSLIRTSDPGVAQEIYFRSIDGEQTFAELAGIYSQGAESLVGGLIGPVELGTAHPIINELISTHSIGQICPPTKLDQWYVVVRLEQLIPARLDPEMYQRLLDELFKTWVQEKSMRIGSYRAI